ncbi:LANO_0G17128g1_1 [Lachancea nothofagi CBS 11611]|uniref:Protein phosphatase methylesterase 1 n=1 Tax=Lachancea nothofagi CBS 11611 TaxID=1266666 RepID=A0A1G4KKE7_9SACH|nr:LANO_0G17128g1_1 [Lachancea nothofagi CBS 11611]
MSDNLRRALLSKIEKADTVVKSDLNLCSTKTSSATSRAMSDDLPTWEDYFQTNEQVSLKKRGFSFNTYFSLPRPEQIPESSENQSVPIFIFHHGAGSSGLSFAPLAQSLTERLDGSCGTYTFDARGHGSTAPLNTEMSETPDYSLKAFVTDFQELLSSFYMDHLQTLPEKLKITFVLVGHSLGGSICTNAFQGIDELLRKKVIGVAMLDIVEEAAILALNTVDSFLNKTPNVFPNYTSAIDWHVQKGLSRLKTSAQITIPSLFYPTASGKVVRKTNLQTFRPFWDTWFQKLSSKFVSLPTSKLLILAGDENLDRELIIGQMQGKFQLVVFHDSGHFIEEDSPIKTAITLIDFWKRNDTQNVVIKTNWTKKDSPVTLH